MNKTIPITIDFKKELKVGELDISQTIIEGLFLGKFTFAPEFSVDKEMKMISLDEISIVVRPDYKEKK